MRCAWLQGVPNIVISLGNFGMLENRSLRRGCRLREVVATGGSTLFTKPEGREKHCTLMSGRNTKKRERKRRRGSGTKSSLHRHVINWPFWKMAATSVNIYSPLSRLRADNHSLLEQLKQGQDDIWHVMKRMNSTKDSFPTRTYGETSFTYRGVDRTPVRVSRKVDLATTDRKQTSTPKSFGQALIADGNDRRNRTPVGPTSILSTPGNRKRVRLRASCEWLWSMFFLLVSSTFLKFCGDLKIRQSVMRRRRFTKICFIRKVRRFSPSSQLMTYIRIHIQYVNWNFD